MSMQLISRPGSGRGAARGERAADQPGKAWLLDPVGLHAEFDELFVGLTDDRGLARFRARAEQLWRSDDLVVHDYIASLPCHTPEEWEAGFEERHLAEWYRVLMAAYIEPTRPFAAPVRLKDHLPEVGWTPSDARRLAWGRELMELAQTYGQEDAAAALEIVLRFGNKGWHDPDDLVAYLDGFRHMDPRWFRRAQHLVPLVEDAFEVLSAAGRDPDRVLLLANG
ncbi:MAG: hypothetical protein U0Q07_03150 [Acidimicrobiales bacterium]